MNEKLLNNIWPILTNTYIVKYWLITVKINYLQLQNAISEVSVAISRGKDDYHSRLAQKLNDPSASSKTYCSILQRFFNGKKVPIISLFLINNKLKSDFEIKANYFNSFFASKCTPFINNSTIPNSLNYVSSAKLVLCQRESHIEHYQCS